MAALLQFNNVAIDIESTVSFNVAAGDRLILEVGSEETKTAVIDMTLGELIPAEGQILLLGQSLAESRPGSIGYIPAEGGLISNLKVWENVTLPLWYHGSRQVMATEESVAHWLHELSLDEQEWEKFMASPAARIKPWKRKLAGLLRGLVLAPQLLLIDANLFDEVDTATSRIWITALEKFVSGTEGRAVLVVANKSTILPWKKIE